jgi:hypothetical protein
MKKRTGKTQVVERIQKIGFASPVFSCYAGNPLLKMKLSFFVAFKLYKFKLVKKQFFLKSWNSNYSAAESGGIFRLAISLSIFSASKSVSSRKNLSSGIIRT